MMKQEKLSGTLCGVAGEYFVAAELSRRGYIASLTLRNTKGVDILASNMDATKSVGVQVKTTQGRGNSWMLNKKVEHETATNLVYVFVRLNNLAAPEYYVVPRDVVASFAATNHETWLAKPARDGKPHRDTDIRQFKDVGGLYKDKWEYLGLD